MIKVGIIGGETQMAGELLRLLLLHPEVEIDAVQAPALMGRSVSSFHRGLAGETELRFTELLPFEKLEKLDVLFIASEEAYFPSRIPEELKVIVIPSSGKGSGSESLPRDLDFVPGLSEMFRKPLVREARAARIMSSPVAVSLIPLFPLALHLMLNDSLSIKVRLPKYKKISVTREEMAAELEPLLKKVQLSFNNIKDIEFEKSNLLRTISVEIEFDCSISQEEIERIYESIYDDHNFTFIMRSDPLATEVAGTQKCLLHINKPDDGKVRVKAIADSFLRGGAGDAIHAMNLLCGLYEKTGLTFPASMAFKHDEIRPEEM